MQGHHLLVAVVAHAHLGESVAERPMLAQRAGSCDLVLLGLGGGHREDRFTRQVEDLDLGVDVVRLTFADPDAVSLSVSVLARSGSRRRRRRRSRALRGDLGLGGDVSHGFVYGLVIQ